MKNKDSIRMVFTGDIAFSRYFENAYRKDDVFAPGIVEYLMNADHVVANVECPLTQKQFKRESKLLHSCDPEVGSFFRAKNMDIWSLANNHMMDCAADGINDTLKAAEDNDCAAIGAAENLEKASAPLVVGENVKVGLVSVARPWPYVAAGSENAGVLTWDKVDLIRDRIKTLRRQVDWIVLVVHGGDEYSDISMPYIRKQYHDLLSLGADIIIGHHPHVVQQYEQIGNKLIVYSLGNFVFDTDMQRNFKHTDRGILFGINFEKTKFTFDHLAVTINREMHLVEISETPAVFRDINEVEYNRLWPLAARIFYKAETKRWLLVQKKSKRSTKLLGIIRTVVACRNNRMRTIVKGKIISYFGKWKRSMYQDVCRYLTE